MHHGFNFSFLIGEMRNDLYITIERGEFEKGGKNVARNVDVTMFIVDSSGQTLKVGSFWSGSAAYCFCFIFNLTG
jgi:hypothetical protein